MDLPLIITSKAIDLELAELLGEKPADFICLCLDGKQLDRFGTPYDTPEMRKERQALVNGLNDRTEKSWWPEMFENWKSAICTQFRLPRETTAKDFHPVASLEIHRVCVGYSKNLHCAIRIFEDLAERIHVWRVQVCAGRASVVIESKSRRHFEETGEDLPLLIVKTVKRLLEDHAN